MLLNALQSGLTLDGGSERDWHYEDSATQVHNAQMLEQDRYKVIVS